MSDVEQSVVVELATKFRGAIEATAKSMLPEAMENFPRGCCGDATLLLAKYLEENGCGPFDYVLGEKDGRSHAWLQKANVVVDITGDQFSDMHYAVFVEPLSGWHASFSGEIQHVANFESYDERTKSMLRWAYGNILATLKRGNMEPNKQLKNDARKNARAS